MKAGFESTEKSPWACPAPLPPITPWTLTLSSTPLILVAYHLIHDLLNYSFLKLSPPPEAFPASVGCAFFYSQHKASTNLVEKKEEWGEGEQEGKGNRGDVYHTHVSPP